MCIFPLQIHSSSYTMGDPKRTVHVGAVTLVTPKIHMYPGGYCPTPVTPRIHRVLLGIRIWSSLANTFVKITKNSATSIEYENWDNISWPHQILRRNYQIIWNLYSEYVTGLSSRPDFWPNEILVTSQSKCFEMGVTNNPYFTILSWSSKVYFIF